MKILWITNNILPAPSLKMGLVPSVNEGWVVGLAEQLSRNKDISLSIATVYYGREIKKYYIDDIEYYLLPCKNKSKYDHNLEDLWVKVCSVLKPDIIHIHGTEYTHGMACMRKLPNFNYVVSIQGLVSVIERYYYANISRLDIIKNITIRDIVRCNTILHGKKRFEKQGVLEKEYITRTENVIGRTSWDLTHTTTINPRVKYHFCNETLRTGFYTSNKWVHANCEPYSIFISQAAYPLKGLHQVLKSMVILKQKYPNIKIKIGGPNIARTSKFSDKIKLSGYAKYLKKIIKDCVLGENVVFLGYLTEKEIIKEYLSSNVYICSSSIENSPNSLGEAQLLGVPVIASYVGGVPDMVEHGITGFLYRFEEIEMLALLINNVFSMSKESLQMLSENQQMEAFKRHNSETNSTQILKIYKSIFDCSSH